MREPMECNTLGGMKLDPLPMSGMLTEKKSYEENYGLDEQNKFDKNHVFLQ